MITVIGSTIMDFTFNTGHFPAPGETTMGINFDQGYGGKGANQAVAAALLGAPVNFVGKVGDDNFGKDTIENLNIKGVKTEYLTATSKSHTGVASIMVTPNGENRIIVITGANDYITTEDIDNAAPVLDNSDYFIIQFEIPIEVVYYIINKYSHKNIILNPAPAIDAKLDISILSKSKYFIPNETEAAAITGIKPLDTESIFGNLKQLKNIGFNNVIITLGSKGSAVCFENEEPAIIEAYKVNAKDTSGAGDAFIGSFASLLYQGKKPADAVKQANIFAALSTQNTGTQKSFPSLEKFNEFI